MIEKLIIERKKLGLNQQEVAAAAGIARMSYSNKELGKMEFNRTQMIKIYEYLREKGSDITFDQLWYK